MTCFKHYTILLMVKGTIVPFFVGKEQMNIQRIRRQSVRDIWPTCDYCDEDFTTGYIFTGEGVSGTRSSDLCVCDGCLDKAKKSKIGFLHGRKMTVKPETHAMNVKDVIAAYHEGKIVHSDLIVRLVQMAVEQDPRTIAVHASDYLGSIKEQTASNDHMISGMEIDSKKETEKFLAGLELWRTYFG